MTRVDQQRAGESASRVNERPYPSRRCGGELCARKSNGLIGMERPVCSGGDSYDPPLARRPLAHRAISAELRRLRQAPTHQQDLPPANEAHRRGVSAANSRKPRDDPSRSRPAPHRATSAAVRGHVCAATRPRGQFGRHSRRGRTGAGVRRAVWPWRVGPALGRHADPARRVLPAESARHGLARQMLQRPVFISAHQPARAV